MTDLTAATHPVLKYFWPIGWIGLNGYFFVALPLSPPVRILVGAFVLLGLYIAWTTSRPLKRVRVGEGVIEAEGLFRTIRIPVSEVERLHVRGDWGRRRVPIVELHLRSGSRIDFIPRSPEAVETLRQLSGMS